MVMDDGVSIRAGLIHNLMKTPFAGGQFIFFVSPLCIYIDDTLFGQMLVGNSGRRNQHAVAIANADIAGGALI
ncbi:Uncharacterised protein [Enterobacter cloacae]|nr:Uncharacterised protein [Enterobacter cloacae]